MIVPELLFCVFVTFYLLFFFIHFFLLILLPIYLRGSHVFVGARSLLHPPGQIYRMFSNSVVILPTLRF